MTSGATGSRIDLRRLVIGTLVGGVALYALGYLIFDMAVASFYAANVGSATGVTRDPQLIWAVVLGSCAYAALITLAIESRAASANIGAAITIGAVVAFLLWFAADFILYGVTNISSLTRTTVDPILELVRGGIAGGIICVVVGRIPEVRRNQSRQTAAV